MISYVLILLVMLFVILAAAELFTNALEHLGERLKISEGTTGSVFAAVGTALPETMVPIIAIFAGTQDAGVNEEIGIGSILGAPLMLSTLSTCLMALVVIRQRGLGGRIAPEHTGFTRDLNFFLFAFVIAAAAMYVSPTAHLLRLAISVLLVLTYLVYVVLTLRASDALVDDGHGTEAEEAMLLSHIGLPENVYTLLLQLVLALALLVAGAKGFIYGVHGLSELLGVSALLISLLVIPIATELPEKVNSILWVRKGKDTLAFGNITGAMVFQGTLLPAIGIALTSWQPRLAVLTGISVTLVAAAWLRLNAHKNGLPVWALLGNGVLYAGYLVLMLR